MNDRFLDLDPDGLGPVAHGIGDLADLLLALDLPSATDETSRSWANELPRIGAELAQVEAQLREIARTVTATDDELAMRFARHGDA
ncbi:hypothetical protein [Micromonospora sp. NPDC047527]|uniref:hypothetical protein n=1 Tax=unclassified Micromonospora TaxID=2617518 RepID=UPI0033DDEAC8